MSTPVSGGVPWQPLHWVIAPLQGGEGTVPWQATVQVPVAGEYEPPVRLTVARDVAPPTCERSVGTAWQI